MKMEQFIKEMLTQDVYIRWTRNGAIVIYTPNEPEMRHQVVYEFDGDGDLEGLLNMLIDIRDQICPGSKYSSQRVSLTLEHGHAYTCTDKDCVICAEEEQADGE